MGYSSYFRFASLIFKLLTLLAFLVGIFWVYLVVAPSQALVAELRSIPDLGLGIDIPGTVEGAVTLAVLLIIARTLWTMFLLYTAGMVLSFFARLATATNIITTNELNRLRRTRSATKERA